MKNIAPPCGLADQRVVQVRLRWLFEAGSARLRKARARRPARARERESAREREREREREGGRRGVFAPAL